MELDKKILCLHSGVAIGVGVAHLNAKRWRRLKDKRLKDKRVTTLEFGGARSDTASSIRLANPTGRSDRLIG